MYATKCHNCLTWIKPISVLLVQGTIVHTDSSQSRSESLADVHPIRSWDGMNVGCLSLGSGNIREEEEEEKEKKPNKQRCQFPRRLLCILPQTHPLTGPSLKDFLLISRKRHHYKLITASPKENIVLVK